MSDNRTRAAGLAVGWQDMAVIYRLAAHLHALGGRAVAEVLIELAGGSNGLAAVQTVLRQYCHLTPGQIASAKADRLPLPRLKVVP